MNWLDSNSIEFEELYQKLKSMADAAVKAMENNPVTSENAEEWANNLVKSVYS